MVSFNQITLSAAALLSLVQYCPAPFAAIPLASLPELGSVAAWVGAAGGVTGGGASAASAIENAHQKKSARQEAGREFNSHIKRGIFGDMSAWKTCHGDLKKATLSFSSPGSGCIVVGGLPASCVTLAESIHGKAHEGDPAPMGNGTVQFNYLKSDTITEIQSELKKHT
ncbi:MAG: hypothetical protein M1821_008809 [Bathelium mastoideum]|nr:MAG: hypothetical protein M1821_008809 [Bathelium mastoideum]